MIIKINCIYKSEGVLCTNHKVEKSLFGFGKRKCILRGNPNKICKYKEEPRKITPPPPPVSKRPTVDPKTGQYDVPYTEKLTDKDYINPYTSGAEQSHDKFEVVHGKNGLEIVRRPGETLHELIIKQENKVKSLGAIIEGTPIGIKIPENIFNKYVIELKKLDNLRGDKKFINYSHEDILSSIGIVGGIKVISNALGTLGDLIMNPTRKNKQEDLVSGSVDTSDASYKNFAFSETGIMIKDPVNYATGSVNLEMERMRKLAGVSSDKPKEQRLTGKDFDKFMMEQIKKRAGRP